MNGLRHTEAEEERLRTHDLGKETTGRIPEKRKKNNSTDFKIVIVLKILVLSRKKHH